MKKLLLKGTHGTTISSAQNIFQDQSFLKTAAENGYTGSGVYLWRDNAYAKDLATLKKMKDPLFLLIFMSMKINHE